MLGCTGGIDQTVTEGEAFGFQIGMTKRQAFERASTLFSADEVTIADPINSQGVGPRRRVSFGHSDWDVLVARDKWRFFFTGPRDSLRLSFRGDLLIEIHRIRQKWEWP